MIVQCPYCSARYDLDAGRLAGPNPMLKCSRCGHIFPAPTSKKQPSQPTPVAAKPVPPAGGNLTLPFEDGGWKDEAEPPPDDLSLPEADEGFILGTEENEPGPVAAAPPPVAPRRVAPPAPAVKEDESEDEEEEVDAVSEEPEEERPAPRPRRRRGRARGGEDRGKMWAIFIFLGLVVAGYAVLTRALFASPALCDRLIGRLPLIGRLGDDRLLVRKVALSEVVGNYQRIKDGKEVFVISGKALNTAPQPLHGVQLIGKLYNGAGDTLDQKTIYCGNVISAKVLKDLTPRELSILQKLSPPKQFVIAPGESSTFVIVFMDPPRQAAEFSAQVLSAQRQA